METLDDARANNLAVGTLIIGFAFGTCLAFATDFILGIAAFAIAAVFDVSKPNGNLRTMGGGTGGGNGRAPLELARSGKGALGGGARKAAKLRLIRVFGGIIRNWSSVGTVLGAGNAYALGRCARI